MLTSLPWNTCPGRALNTPGSDGVLATIELDPNAEIDALPDGIYAQVAVYSGKRQVSIPLKLPPIALMVEIEVVHPTGHAQQHFTHVADRDAGQRWRAGDH
jgi:hypothetical protein